MIPPVSLNTSHSSVMFSGNTRASVERMVNSLFNAEDTFSRIDQIEAEKIRPWYERLAGDVLRIGSVRDAREVHQSAARMDRLLIDALDEADYSKTGGLESIYWRAYHLPGKLLDNQKSPNAVRRVERFVRDSYVPFLKSLNTEEERWTVMSLAEGICRTALPGEALLLIEKMGSLSAAQPHWFQALQDVFGAHRDVLADTVYAVQFFAPKSDREAIYLQYRDGFVKDVITPVLDALDGNSPPHEVTQRYLKDVLPKVATGLGQHLSMETPEQYFAGVRADALTLLWRVLVLDGDMLGTGMPEAVARQFGESIIRLQIMAGGEQQRYDGPDMPVTHCNLSATIPDHY